MQHTTEAAKQYQCRHIFTDGHRCASPCLRQEEFCYYHHTTRKPVANPKQRRSRHSTFHLPLPEDRSAIQSSIGEVLQRIAANDIDPRRAGLLLYGLQIASLNLPKQQNTQRHARPEPVETVEEITIDPTLGVLAPRAEVSGITKPKSVVAQLIERMMLSENEEAAATREPTILPTLNAESAIASMHFHDDGCPTSRFWDVGSTGSPHSPKTRHFDRRRRTCRRSGEICCCLCRLSVLLKATQNRNRHFNWRRTHSAALPAHIPANFHRLDSHNIATSKSKIPQHSHSLNLPQKLPVFSRKITK
jgi:hypothetical protein